MSNSYKPTKKWLAALITGLASILASVIITGELGDVERGMAATLLVSLTGAYFKSNDQTPGGVPDARSDEHDEDEVPADFL